MNRVFDVNFGHFFKVSPRNHLLCNPLSSELTKIIAEIANSVSSSLELQCLLSFLQIFNMIQVE